MTGARRRTPPGRAGRLRVRHSLDVAVRGADLLEQKLRILRSRHQRLLRAEEAAARAWRELLAEAATSVPARPPTAAAPSNTALVHAEAVYARAVRAAAEYAAAHAAAELVGAEVLSTRHRVRALRRHWIPRLRETLDQADLALEQAEHEDSVRRRWAAGTTER